LRKSSFQALAGQASSPDRANVSFDRTIRDWKEARGLRFKLLAHPRVAGDDYRRCNRLQLTAVNGFIWGSDSSKALEMGAVC
jgi:hypothetical protein